MKNFLLIASFLSATGGFLSAASVSISGDTTGGAAFNRPTVTGALSSQNGVPYAQFNVTVALSGIYTFSVAADNPISFDTFTHLYGPGFDPLDPETNFLTANDDATANPNDGSSFTYELDAGSSYVFLVDGFLGAGSPDAGAFSGTISGPGSLSVTAVPEPGSALASLLSVGVGVAFCTRRRAWKKSSSR